MMPQAMPEAIDHSESFVHEWCAAQLRRLGTPEPLAEVYADRLDWHQVARLGVASGIWGGTTEDERRALRRAVARRRNRARSKAVHE